MNSFNTSNPETLETQVAVLGGGGAGMAAAVTVAEKGADVILVERHKKPGGASAMAFGIFGAETHVQKRLNIEAPKDLLFKIAMDYSHWTIDPMLIRAFLDKSADTIKWLEDQGTSFNIPLVARQYFKQDVPRVWHCPPGYGAEIIDVLTNSFSRLGGRLLNNARATEILSDSQGNITGVLAEGKEKEYKIKARSVIIATGGYGANKEMMREYCPYYSDNMYLDGFPNTGDGILMGMKIGAATEGLGTIWVEYNGIQGSVPRIINDLAGLSDTIWLNKKGHRFVDESAFHHRNPGAFNTIPRQPETTNYTLFDQGILQKVLDDQQKTLNRYRNLKFGKRREKGTLDEIMKSASDKGIVRIAETTEEIAEWMGADPAVLRFTIEKYNTFCKQGHDDDFLKESRYLLPFQASPYYAIKCVPRYIATMGGIKINHKMEVLNEKEIPIPGLYAAGTDTTGWEPETYNSFLHATFYGFAVNSGRIAGENAARC